MNAKTPTKKAPKLEIRGVRITRPTPESQAAGGVRAWLDLSVEVENLSDELLYVWSKDRGYTYDASTHVLAVHLAEVPLNLPPTIKLLSDHPSPPHQVEVAPKSRANIRVRIPAFTRPVVDGRWREEPIGQIDRTDIDVQYGTEPVEPPRTGESAPEFRKRLLAYGAVSQGKITPTAGTGTPNEKER